MKTEFQFLLETCAEKLRIDTLETRNRDSLDFHQLAVWEIKEIIQMAYEAGRRMPLWSHEK